MRSLAERGNEQVRRVDAAWVPIPPGGMGTRLGGLIPLGGTD
ncbi:MAG TPA: hypothetical protein VES59_06685 [Bacteroidota bacterium]|nr:hypothetical protein [Bacteroidota bacterium]